jgi:hypothetical protein
MGKSKAHRKSIECPIGEESLIRLIRNKLEGSSKCLSSLCTEVAQEVFQLNSDVRSAKLKERAVYIRNFANRKNLTKPDTNPVACDLVIIIY